MNYYLMKFYPSIFNDVIGPVMRGPSSSHCAASLRIGRMCRDLMEGRIDRVLIEFDTNGSLATTHESQGSDMGLFGGFLGMTADDERLVNSAGMIETHGIDVQIRIHDIGADHPNTYKITLWNREEEHEMIAISTGGGMIRIDQIDGAPVQMYGDYYETLIYTNEPEPILRFLEQSIRIESATFRKGLKPFIEVQTVEPFPDTFLPELSGLKSIRSVKKLYPVLPILSREKLKIPFLSCREMEEYNSSRGMPLWELATIYEMERGNISGAEVHRRMTGIVRIMRTALENGLKGTHYEDRILGPQSVKYRQQLEKGSLLGGDLTNKAIMYVSAIMEVKSSMGVIVAAPTAGSCGALPGTVLAVADSLNLPEEKVVESMLTAGLIGLFITEHATFAAEVGGCQAECGAGSCMAAAAVVELAGGTVQQSLSAASMALQNSLGMICDPIANRVEAPCLGKNVMASTNALACANMALAGYDQLIPLDEVIDTMADVAAKMDASLRCTGLGGLAATHTSKEIEKKLKSRQFFKSC